MSEDEQLPPAAESSLRDRLSVTLDVFQAPMVLEVLDHLHSARPLTDMPSARDFDIDTAVSHLVDQGLVTDDRPTGGGLALTETGQRFFAAIETVTRTATDRTSNS